MLSIFFQAAVRSFGMAAVVWVVLRVFRVRSPRSLSIIWTAVLFSALSMPVLMSAMQVILDTAPPAAVAWIPTASSPVPLAPLAVTATELSPPVVHWATLLAAVYGLVASVLLFRLGVGFVRGERLRRTATRLEEIGASGWDIRISSQIPIPITFGRTILLPPESREWSEFKRAAVLAHEQSHVVRGDFYIQLLAGIHRALFWFSPMAWWLQKELLNVSESVCDDEAVDTVGDRVSYAEVLVDFTKIISKHRFLEVAMARGKTVERRIERILSEGTALPGLSALRKILVTGVMLPVVGFAAGGWLVKAEGTQEVQRANPPGAGVLSRWIEDVQNIATGEEQSGFKSLATDEQRERFIEQFWFRRDPTPGTVANEFRDEYFRRIAVANQRFGSSRMPGWTTDRGRVLIRFGDPDEIEIHAAGTTYIREGTATRTVTFPFELWRYRFIEGLGRDVRLEFVDVSRDGEHRLTLDPNERGRLLGTTP